MDKIRDKFTRCGLNPSHQRLSIYNHLQSRYDHPTAEMVYYSLIGTMPTLSKTTVYNTLRLFCEHGIASLIHTEDAQMRFDANTSFHTHFKCSKCGRVIDVDVGDKVKEISLPGFAIESKQLILFGRCNSCAD